MDHRHELPDDVLVVLLGVHWMTGSMRPGVSDYEPPDLDGPPPGRGIPGVGSATEEST